jgi:hypothetical protein
VLYGLESKRDFSHHGPENALIASGILLQYRMLIKYTPLLFSLHGTAAGLSEIRRVGSRYKIIKD